jgi:hypothetical protein
MVERNRPFRLDRAHAHTADIGELSQIAGQQAMVVTLSRSLVLPPPHVQIGYCICAGQLHQIAPVPALSGGMFPSPPMIHWSHGIGFRMEAPWGNG